MEPTWDGDRTGVLLIATALGFVAYWLGHHSWTVVAVAFWALGAVVALATNHRRWL